MSYEGARKFPQELVVEALRERWGNINKAAEYIRDKTGGTCSRRTLDKYIALDAELQDLLKEVREVALDVAEDGLFYHIRQRHLTAIIYYLNHHGYDRGYNVRPVLYGKDPRFARALAQATAAAKHLDFTGLSDDELRAVLDGLDKAARAADRGGGVAEEVEGEDGGPSRPVH